LNGRGLRVSPDASRKPRNLETINDQRIPDVEFTEGDSGSVPEQSQALVGSVAQILFAFKG